MTQRVKTSISCYVQQRGRKDYTRRCSFHMHVTMIFVYSGGEEEGNYCGPMKIKQKREL